MPPKKRTTKNRALPKYWRVRNATYYYRVPSHLRHLHDGKVEISLGQSLSSAYKKFASLYQVEECMTVMRELFDRYRLEVVPEKAINTRKANHRSLDRLRPALGGNLISTVTPEAIKKYKHTCARKHSKKYANLDLEVLSHVFTWAIEWGITSTHPMTGKLVTKFKLEGRKRYVEDWELAEWWSVASPFLRAYAILKGATGLRKQDMLTIKRSDISETELVSVNIKTGKAQRFPLYDEAGNPTSAKVGLDGVQSYYAEFNAGRRVPVVSPWLFHTRKGECYWKDETSGGDDTCSGFDSIFSRSMNKAIATTTLVERFGDHDLRVKVGSDLDSDLDAMKLMNHSSPAVTKKHYRLRGSKMEPAPGFSVGEIKPKK